MFYSSLKNEPEANNFRLFIMKKILLFTLLLGTLSATSQSVLQLRADTVKIFKNGGYAELVLRNRTMDTLGFLMSTGGGKTKFSRPYKIDDTTLVIGRDTFAVGSGSAGLSESDVQQLIDDAIALINNAFDDSTIIGAGTVSDKRRVNLSIIATREMADSISERVDSILLNWPIGSTAGKTQIENINTTGDTLTIKINDSLWSVKRLIAGTNVTFTVTGNSITINGTSGSEEVNTLSFSATGTTNVTVSAEAIIEKVLVDPASDLIGLTIGTLSEADKFFPSTPVIANGSEFTIFDVGAYISASTAIYFAPGAVNTSYKLIFKLIHE